VFVQDGAKAARWTVEHIGGYGGSPDCVYLMGHSAGAHIAAMLTLDESYFQAEKLAPGVVCGMIGLAGPYDFLPLTADNLKDIFAPAEDLAQTQPIHFVDGSGPPLLLMTGADDTA
jgi:acetyl esterase/lipase